MITIVYNRSQNYYDLADATLREETISQQQQKQGGVRYGYGLTHRLVPARTECLYMLLFTSVRLLVVAAQRCLRRGRLLVRVRGAVST